MLRRLAVGIVAAWLASAGTTAALAAGNAEQDWYAAIQERIRQAIYYPQDPARRDQPLDRGTVKLKITVNREGRLFTPVVHESSGSPLLDAAALAAVIQSNPLPPPPADLRPDRREITLILPVTYRPEPCPPGSMLCRR